MYSGPCVALRHPASPCVTLMLHNKCRRTSMFTPRVGWTDPKRLGGVPACKLQDAFAQLWTAAQVGKRTPGQSISFLCTQTLATRQFPVAKQNYLHQANPHSRLLMPVCLRFCSCLPPILLCPTTTILRRVPSLLTLYNLCFCSLSLQTLGLISFVDLFTLAILRWRRLVVTLRLVVQFFGRLLQ